MLWTKEECEVPEPPRDIPDAHREWRVIKQVVDLVARWEKKWRGRRGRETDCLLLESHLNRYSPIKLLGYGGSRFAFDLGHNEVLKVLYHRDPGATERRLNPNREEARHWATAPTPLARHLCPVRALDDHGNWLVMPKAIPLPIVRMRTDEFSDWSWGICRSLGIFDCFASNWGYWCYREVLIDYAE